MDKLRAHADRGTVESVFDDFKGRRAGLLKALTTEVEKFHQECDPEKENLCLYGLPDETWEVSMPVEEIPPELPEPVLGINFARDGMEEKHWLSLVAVHGDSWLLSVAFYLGARFGFGKSQRKKLFQMINGVPTLYEVVQLKYNGNKTKPNGKTVAEFAQKLKGPSATQSNGNKRTMSEEAEPHPKTVKMSPPAKEYDENDEEEEAEGEDDEQENTLCGVCGENYEADEFWIGCDVCEKWFHGACVKVTPAKAEHIKHYKCPTCSSKRARIPM